MYYIVNIFLLFLTVLNSLGHVSGEEEGNNASPCTAATTGGSGNDAYTTDCGDVASESSCTLTCSATGYSGNSTRLCTDGAFGTLVAPTCTAKTCTPSGSVDNSDYSAAGSITGTTGEVVTVACDIGYQANFKSTTTLCQPSGSFVDLTGLCAPDLCTPTAVANSNKASAESITGVTGDLVAVACNDGYSGGGTATCGTGSYFNTLSCSANTCTPAGSVANSNKAAAGSITGTTGDQVSVNCDIGYQANSETLTTTCGLNGEFNPVTCAPMTCSASVANSDHQEDYSLTKTTGQSVVVTCNQGYWGGGTATCGTDGQFNTVTCEDIDECTAGTHNCDTNADCGDTDGSFTCTCKSGYFGDGTTCTAWKQCSAGERVKTAADATNDAECETCPINLWHDLTLSADTGTVSWCNQCGTGYGVLQADTATAHATCVECDGDNKKYSIGNDNSACDDHTECAAGFGTNFLTLSDQDKREHNAVCVACDQNTYSSEAGFGTCLAHTTCGFFTGPGGTQGQTRLTGASKTATGTCAACYFNDGLGRGTYALTDTDNCQPHTCVGFQVDGTTARLTGASAHSAGTCDPCGPNTYAPDGGNCVANTECGNHFDGTTRLIGASRTEAGTCAACASGYHENSAVPPNCVPDPCTDFIADGGSGTQAYTSSCTDSNVADGDDCTLTCDFEGYYGSSSQRCTTGSFALAAPNCEPITCTPSGSVANSDKTAANSITSVFGQSVPVTCNTGYSGGGNVACDSKGDFSEVTCEDIDECTAGTHNCDANADCDNTVGSFTCTCKSGYFGAGTTDTCTAHTTCGTQVGGVSRLTGASLTQAGTCAACATNTYAANGETDCVANTVCGTQVEGATRLTGASRTEAGTCAVCAANTYAADSTVVTVTSSTGRVWIDRNQGALQVAASSTDAPAYGNLFQWGRSADGHEFPYSQTIDVQSDTPGNKFVAFDEDWRQTPNDALWDNIDGVIVNNPCPAGFQVPTEAEWITEKNSWETQDAAGAYASPLKLTKTNYREENGELAKDLNNDINEIGLYWSSTLFSGNLAVCLSFDGFTGEGWKSSGISVRCIKVDNVPLGTCLANTVCGLKADGTSRLTGASRTEAGTCAACASGYHEYSAELPNCVPDLCTDFIADGGSGTQAYTSSCTDSAVVDGEDCVLTCTEGYSGDSLQRCTAGTFALAVPTCTAKTCTPSGSVANSDKAAAESITGTTGQSVAVTCNSGYSGSGTANCGTDGQFNTVTCEDIDECTAGTHNCDTNADCGDTDGSFTCTCKSGYFGAGTTDTCTAWLPCNAGEFVQEAADATHDTVCGTCETGLSRDPTTGTDLGTANYCNQCGAGYGKDSGDGTGAHMICETCNVADEEYSSGTDASECAEHLKCIEGQGSNYGSLTAEEKRQQGSVCNTCDDNYYSADFSFGACVANTVCGFQADGTSRLTGASRTAAGTCAACADNTYAPNGNTNCLSNIVCTGLQLDSTVRINGATRLAVGTCDACDVNTYAPNGNTNCLSNIVCTGLQSDSSVRINGATRLAVGTCDACAGSTYATTDTDDCVDWTACHDTRWVIVAWSHGQPVRGPTGASSTTPGTCAACAGNTYATTDTDECVAWKVCLAGSRVETAASATNDAECETCEDNLSHVLTSSEDTGTVSWCNQCVAGYGVLQGVTATAHATCERCDAGVDDTSPTYNNQVDETACGPTTPCVPGTGYHVAVAIDGNEDADRCEVCDAGTYSGDTDYQACKTCGAGSIAESGAGTGVVASGATSCTACGIGKYSASSTSDCETCANGSVTEKGTGTGPVSSAATSCTSCGSGKFSADSVAMCQDCAAGSVTEKGAGTGVVSLGATSCTACGSGKYSASSSSACSDCSQDEFSAAGSVSCTACSTVNNLVTTGQSTGQAWCESCKSGFTPSEVSGSHTTCTWDNTCNGRVTPEFVTGGSECATDEYFFVRPGNAHSGSNCHPDTDKYKDYQTNSCCISSNSGSCPCDYFKNAGTC